MNSNPEIAWCGDTNHGETSCRMDRTVSELAI